MRVALLVPGFSIQGYLKDLLDVWNSDGHQVTVFRTKSGKGHDTAELEYWNMPLFEIEDRDLLSRGLGFIDRKAYGFFGMTLNLSLMLLKVRFLKVIKEDRYDFFIGVEKVGVIIANSISKRFAIPYLYYSLELYIEEHPAYSSFAHLRVREKKAQASALATIIQDKRRADILSKANELKNHPYVYLPIGSSEIPAKPLIEYSNSPFIILYIGILNKNRRINDLIEVATRLLGDELLYLHSGYFNDEFTDSNYEKVIISVQLLNALELANLIRKAHIGVALYQNAPLNDRLTAFSSHKVALYLQHAKPIIVPKNESYTDLLSEFKCGEMIESIKDMPEAIQRIRKNYKSYSYAARLAYEAHFNINKKAPLVMKSIVDLLSNRNAELDHAIKPD